jgi:isopentenyl diphosphate isomerase/L-lactate dehydrogenase-like FMN-dependent dehydrogenase
MGLSSFASKPIEDVIAANPRLFFQMYWVGDRDEMAARMERARKAGAVGVIVTLDWSFSFGRDWGSPRIPEQMTAPTTWTGHRPRSGSCPTSRGPSATRSRSLWTAGSGVAATS